MEDSYYISSRVQYVLMGIGVSLLIGSVTFAGLRSYTVESHVAAATESIPVQENAKIDHKKLDPVVEAFGGIRDVPEGFSEYRSIRYGYSLLHPNSLAVTRIDEGNGARTILFQDDKAQLGFQIFIVPHLEDQVSEERFRKDTNGAERTNVRSISIDGAVGAAFHTTDSNLGDTLEVWFVHKGLLYEVITYRHLESWVFDIIETWKFM